MPNKLTLVAPNELIGMSIGEAEKKYGIRILSYSFGGGDEIPAFKSKILKDDYTIRIAENKK